MKMVLNYNMKKPKNKIRVIYHLDHDPKEDEDWGRHSVEEEIVEIETPEPSGRPEDEVDYNFKKKKKAKLKCDDYIEVPGGTESVTYTDDEGQSYEVDVGDLINYDGDDGEIQITKSKKPKVPYYLLNRSFMGRTVRTR